MDSEQQCLETFFTTLNRKAQPSPSAARLNPGFLTNVNAARLLGPLPATSRFAPRTFIRGGAASSVNLITLPDRPVSPLPVSSRPRSWKRSLFLSADRLFKALNKVRQGCLQNGAEISQLDNIQTSYPPLNIAHK